MTLAIHLRARIATAFLATLAAGCGGGGGGDNGGGTPPPPPPPPPGAFQVGGTVAGLSTTGLVLANGGSTVSVAAGASSFNFADKLAGGAAYGVSVKTQPAGQTCSVTNGSGTVGSADVTNIAVSCRNYVAFVANRNNNTLGQFSLGANGALSPMATANINVGAEPRDVAVSADGRFAYVVNSDPAAGNSIQQYTLATNGSLTATGSPVATDLRPVDLQLSPDGKFAYVADYDSNTLRQYSVGADGSLSALATARVNTAAGPSAVAESPDSKHVYVANYLGGSVQVFNVASDGTVTLGSTATLASGSGPRSIAITPDGRFMYVTLGVSNSIAQFAVNADGSLTPLSSPTMAAGTFPDGIVVTPDGKFVYAANFNGGSISTYSVGADGRLGIVDGGSHLTGMGPRGMSLTPDGKYLYVTNLSDSTVTQFSINADGTLNTMGTTVLSQVASPWSIVVK